MIPILRKDEIEAGAEELLLRLCPNALSDLNEHNAFVLAERMGLNVERLPLYNKSRTLSMLFFCAGTVTVQDDPPSPEADIPRPLGNCEETVCANCGKPILDYARKKRRYCSHECYIRDRFWRLEDGREPYVPPKHR